MRKLINFCLIAVMGLTGCGANTYNTVALNFTQKDENYQLIPDENAENYNQLLTDLDSLGVELNSDTKVAVVATSTANIIDRLGMNIVGVTSSDDLDDNLKAGLDDGSVTDLGSPMSVNLEQLTTLDEDIVFVGSNMPYQEEYDSIDNLIVLPQVYYYDIFYTISGLISEFSLDQGAQDVFNQMVLLDQQAKEISSSYDGEPKSAAVLKYAYGNFTIAPDNTYAGSLATELGISNVYGDYTDIELPVDKEKLLADDPEYIILYGKGDDMQAEADKLLADPTFQTLSAAKNDKVIVLQSISLNADIDSAQTLYDLSMDVYES